MNKALLDKCPATVSNYLSNAIETLNKIKKSPMSDREKEKAVIRFVKERQQYTETVLNEIDLVQAEKDVVLTNNIVNCLNHLKALSFSCGNYIESVFCDTPMLAYYSWHLWSEGVMVGTRLLTYCSTPLQAETLRNEIADYTNNKIRRYSPEFTYSLTHRQGGYNEDFRNCMTHATVSNRGIPPETKSTPKAVQNTAIIHKKRDSKEEQRKFDWLVIAIALVLLVVLVIRPLLANMTMSNCERFEYIVEAVHKGKIDSRGETLLKKLRLDSSKGLAFTSEDLRSYLTNHSIDEYFDAIQTISSLKGICTDDLLSLVLLCNEINSGSVKDGGSIFARESTDGYYKEHPSAQPRPSTSKVSGKFNDASNENAIYSDSKTNSTTVTYYGDFAIAETEEYIYNPGIYKWVNGVFYDQPPRWDYSVETELWCMGKRMNCQSKYSMGNALIYRSADALYIFNEDSSAPFMSIYKP